MDRPWLRVFFVSFVSLWFISFSSAADPLPGTKPLTEQGDLARKMVDGIHKYLDRELADAPEKRKRYWADGTPRQDRRDRLAKILGVGDPRVKPHMEYVGGPDEPSLVAEEGGAYRVHAVRWAVLPGVDAEGLLVEPVGEKPISTFIAIPDADWTPEQFFGLAPGVPLGMQIPRYKAVNRRVLIPTLIDRRDDYSANPKLNRATNLSHREFVHRMAYEMGRTLVGYEVQKVLAAVDWIIQKEGPDHRIEVFGYGEGGAVATFAAALDDRIVETTVTGYVEPRERVWQQPLDRDVWSQLLGFGDAEMLTYLTRPKPDRSVDVPMAAPVELYAGPRARPGRSGAAPGTIRTPRPDLTIAETARIKDAHISGGSWPSHGDYTPPEKAPTDRRKHFDPAARQKRQFDQLVGFTQKLWRDSDLVRKEFWKKADASSPEKWEQSCEWYRDYFHREVIGKLPDPTVPMNPRTRQLYDEPNWTGYEVVLDVFPDVFAYGILLLPKDLKPGERRPVVVCQHGLESRPQDVCNPKAKTRSYHSYGARLADRGYIVYAPQNPYIFEDHFRQIQRKGHPLGLSLFSFIIAQHRRTLDWLETLPQVDPKKIGFYGLSYGGKTAMRVPAVEKRYCLSICSGDFNEWVGKNVSVDLDRSYMWTREYDMYEFDLGNTFDYAEMAYLIAPRPFMVERGHDDGVGTDEMVAWEYAKVRYLYANKLHLPDRTAIEFSPGGHEIFLKGTLAFLEKHLGKPR